MIACVNSYWLVLLRGDRNRMAAIWSKNINNDIFKQCSSTRAQWMVDNTRQHNDSGENYHDNYDIK